MIKKFVIGLINIYKKIPGPWHGTCIYYPTCSTYAIDAIEEYGVGKGIIMAIKRILRCNPWQRGGYDPVRLKEK